MEVGCVGRGHGPGEVEAALLVVEAGHRHRPAVARRIAFLDGGQVAGFAGGRYLDGGGEARGMEGAAFMAQIAALNDPRALQEHCGRTMRQQGNGTTCDLPPVWVRRAGR